MEFPNKDNESRPTAVVIDKRDLRPLWLFLSLILVLTIGGIIYSCAPSQLAVIDEGRELDKCVQNLVAANKNGNLDETRDALSKATGYCAQHRYYGDWLGDWQVRRTSFALQQYNGKVMLAMVVALTITGVFLAAIQLSTALKLASVSGNVEAGGKLVFEQGKLSLSSSVTGLIILALSFGFFSVYAICVYPLKPIAVDPAPLMPAASKQVPDASASETKTSTSPAAPATTFCALGSFGPGHAQGGLTKGPANSRHISQHRRSAPTPATTSACAPQTGSATLTSKDSIQ